MTVHGAGYKKLAKAALDKLTRLTAGGSEVQQLASDQAKMQAAAKRKAEEEARADAVAARKAEAEAKRRAEADAKLKEEAKRKADELARAEAEAKRKAEQARLQAEQEAKAKLAAQQTKPATSAIAMAPANETSTKPEPSAIDTADLASLLQVHLKQVGCDPGGLNGAWNDKTSHAMGQFNANAHTKFNVKVASLDALEAVKAHKDRVCPLECGKGQKAEGDRCVAEACKRGYIHNKDGECVREAKTAQRPRRTSMRAELETPFFATTTAVNRCRKTAVSCRTAVPALWRPRFATS